MIKYLNTFLISLTISSGLYLINKRYKYTSRIYYYILNEMLLTSIMNGNFQQTYYYINSGGDVNYTNKYGESLLSIAIENENSDIVSLLVNMDVEVNYYIIEKGRMAFNPVINKIFLDKYLE